MRILTFLLIISAFFGGYLFLVDSTVHFIRIVPIIFIVIGFVYRVKLDLDAQVILGYFSIFFVYTFIISIFNFQNILGNDLINLTVLYLFMVALIVSVSIPTVDYFKIFRRAIVFFMLASIVVWVYEFTTHKHLRYSLAANFDVNYYYQPTTTFFTNPNDFAVVFTLCSMYMLSILKKEGSRNKLIIALLIVITFAIEYTTEARLCFLGFMIFIAFYLKIWKARIALGIGVVVVLILLYLNLDWDKLLSFESAKRSSIDIRQDLYYHGVMSIFHNYGLGFGIRGYHYYYSDIAHIQYTDPHNFILELLISSGVGVTLMYITLIIIIFVKLLKSNSNHLTLLQFILYNFMLSASSASLFLWPHYLFFVAYVFESRSTLSSESEKELR